MGRFRSRRFFIDKGLLVLLGLLVFWAPATMQAQETEQSSGNKTDAGLPSLAVTKDCLKEPRSTECLDNLFREALRNYTTADVLQLIEGFEAEDPEFRRDCHPVVHAIGRETFRLKGNIHDSFSACDQTCHSGCYHGSVERFLRGDDVYSESYKHPSQAELKQKATAACDSDTPLRLRYQCLHGLGHAILFFSAYQLQSSLDICDALGDDWSRSSCYGGVFMENVSNSTNETKEFQSYGLPRSLQPAGRSVSAGMLHHANLKDDGDGALDGTNASGVRKSWSLSSAVHAVHRARPFQRSAHGTTSRRRSKVRVGRERQSLGLHAGSRLCTR